MQTDGRDPSRVQSLEIRRITLQWGEVLTSASREFGLNLLVEGTLETLPPPRPSASRSGTLFLNAPGQADNRWECVSREAIVRQFLLSPTCMSSIVAELNGGCYGMPRFPLPCISDTDLFESLHAVHQDRLARNPIRIEAEVLRKPLQEIIMRYALYPDETLSALSEQDPILRAARFLRRNFALNPNLDQLADEVGLSKYHLLREFKKRLGTTPHRHLMSIRDQQARSLLLEGLPANEVAKRCGYCNPSHLCNSLKTHFGVSPGELLKESD